VDVWWEAPPAGTATDLAFSCDGGATWAEIASGLRGRRHPWHIPAGLYADACRIRVTVRDRGGACVGEGVSEEPFPVGGMSFTAPSGGERLPAGSVQSFRWSLHGSAMWTWLSWAPGTETLNLLLSRDDGSTWSGIASGRPWVRVGQDSVGFLWQVPAPGGTPDCRLKIQVVRDGAVVVESVSERFAIVTPPR
jgi:hypothetical protein